MSEESPRKDLQLIAKIKALSEANQQTIDEIQDEKQVITHYTYSYTINRLNGPSPAEEWPLNDPIPITLSDNDLACLEPNGPAFTVKIMDLYLRYLEKVKFKDEVLRKRFYCFDTSFYRNLHFGGYQSVRNLTDGYICL